MNIPEAISLAKLSKSGIHYSHLYIHKDAYPQFRAFVQPWEAQCGPNGMYFLGMLVEVVNDPLNIWRLA